jgi:flavin reductase (DIM6/NTAB) family NADH-FMN oxidoreductase RutF
MGATATFNALVGDLDYPMFIVTTSAGGERAGCLVGFATQTSIDPSRFLVCLSRSNHTYRVARRARTPAVHWVPADAAELAELFGGETGDTVDKFARVAWHPGPGEAPILEDCPSWFAGRILERLAAGDHVAFLVEPVAAHRDANAEELSFHRAKRIAPGHPA